uniref:Uncharacterized protein n=1 Tax=Salmonella phage vB_SE130_2P TaxID=3236707 RepID=A0AB39C3Y4_9VIRU
MRWITIDDWNWFPVACPSRERVIDSGPPISGVADVSEARLSVKLIAPSGPSRTEDTSISVSSRNLFNSVRSYSLPASEKVLAARHPTNATLLFPNSNCADAPLSLVMVNVSISLSGAAPS